MADLKIVTRQIPNVEPNPPQPSNPSEYFGEQSNDIQLSVVNDFATISGIDKLKQDLNKVLLTELGQNINFEIYGTEINGLVGTKVGFDELRARIRDQVKQALQVLELLNRENTNDDEVPDRFLSLAVEKLDNDRFEVQVGVVTRSGKSLSSDPILF